MFPPDMSLPSPTGPDKLRAWAEIDLAALADNARACVRIAGENARLLAVVKADGYGHGIVEVATALAPLPEVWGFGVANLEEAQTIAGAISERQKVLILGPVLPDEREAAYKAMCHFVDCTQAMGATVICGPFDQQLGYFSGVRPTKQEWDWSVQVMRKSCEYALDKGVEIAIEPLNRFEQYILNTVEDGVKYIKQIDMPN